MTTLLLIRHGESEANRQGIFAGQINPDLQNKGLKQAQMTAKHIASHYKIDRIYSSDLKRAYKTALCLADICDLEVIQEQGLREINAGKWEGMKFDDLVSAYPDEYGIWLNNIGISGCVGGESVKQLADRVMSSLTKIATENDGKTVAVVSHGTPIRAVQSLIQTGELKEMKDIPWVSNASVTVVEYKGGAWTIAAVSQDSHLAELKTELPQNV